MAARKQLFHPDDVRKKIQASQLINLLQRNANGDLPVELTRGRIKSAEILLRKSIADLSSVELTGKDGGAIQHEVGVTWMTEQEAKARGWA